MSEGSKIDAKGQERRLGSWFFGKGGQRALYPPARRSGGRNRAANTFLLIKRPENVGFAAEIGII